MRLKRNNIYFTGLFAVVLGLNLIQIGCPLSPENKDSSQTLAERQQIEEILADLGSMQQDLARRFGD